MTRVIRSAAGAPGALSACHAGITDPGYNAFNDRAQFGHLIQTDERVYFRK